MSSARSFSTFRALVVLLASFPAYSHASSTRPRPLKRIEHPSTLVLEILPRSTAQRRSGDLDWTLPFPTDDPALHHTDSIRLTLSSFDQDYHLHLQPNDHLIHPSARINYFRLAPDGRTSVLDHTEPLTRDAVMAYEGDVVHVDHSFQRLREDVAGGLAGPSAGALGWARIIVHHQGDINKGLAPIFEGSFAVNGVIHHVVTTENYLRNKHPLDPHLEDHALDGNLVIFRDSDVMSSAEEASGLPSDGTGGVTAHSCAHDSLEFNRDNERHPVLRVGAGLDRQRHRPSWFEPFWHGESLDSGPQGVDMNLGLDVFPRDDLSGNVSSNFINDIGKTDGCSRTQKIVYMGVAADCAYTAHYGGVANATTQILSNWNVASALYKSTFNVSLGIVEMNVQDPTCPKTPDPNTPWNLGCGASATLNDRLSLFSQWRGAKGDSDGAGLWHLMSGCPTGTEVGVAWLGTLCQTKSTGSGSSIVSGTAVTTATRTEWGVVAHEIGHNFGAIHDCTTGCSLTDSCCPSTSSTCDANAAFLMNPVSESQQSVFSPCTIGNICTSMQTINDTCVQDIATPRKTIALQQCGNGIVEDGEDCDPGFGRNSTCCNAQCKFTSGSVCDPATSDCCTSSCQLAPSTQVCRAARDKACDTSEMCSGSSATCPVDHTMRDGMMCGRGLTCAAGACTSKNLQCKTVGASMNLTTACRTNGDTSCSVSCQSPNNSNECIILQSLWIDGSSCGYGGTCHEGSCRPGSLLAMGKSWFLNNLQISIPVVCIGGFLVLFIIWAMFLGIRRLCKGSPRTAASAEFLAGKSSKGRVALSSHDELDPNDVASLAYGPARNGGGGRPSPGSMSSIPPSLRAGESVTVPPQIVWNPPSHRTDRY